MARLDSPAKSVDHRLKVPAWMNEFEQRGGELVIQEAGITDIEAYGQNHDLVIVASGKGEISGLFERDAAKSPFDKPQRSLALPPTSRA